MQFGLFTEFEWMAGHSAQEAFCTSLAQVDEAERLVRKELRIPTEALASLDEGVYYRHDLVGCQVTTIGGTTVGVVRRVEAGPGPSRLVVRSAEGDDIEVPFAADICVRVDPPARSIVIDPPEGLLDLNRK